MTPQQPAERQLLVVDSPRPAWRVAWEVWLGVCGVGFVASYLASQFALDLHHHALGMELEWCSVAHNVVLLASTYGLLFNNQDASVLALVQHQYNVGLIFIFLIVNVVLDVCEPLFPLAPVFGVTFSLLAAANLRLDALAHRVSRLFRAGALVLVLVVLVPELVGSFVTHFPCSPDSAVWEYCLPGAAACSHVSPVSLHRTVTLQLVALHLAPASLAVRNLRSARAHPFVTRMVLKKRGSALPSPCAEGTACFNALAFVGFCCAYPQAPPARGLLRAALEWGTILFGVTTTCSVAHVLRSRCELDVQVLARLGRQFSVWLIVACVVGLMVLDWRFLEGVDVLGSFLFLVLILLNISLDAVRGVSRRFRTAACGFVVVIVLLRMVRYYTTSKCQDDALARATSGRMSLVEVQRNLTSTIFVAHCRAFLVLLSANVHDPELHPSAFVLEHVAMEGGSETDAPVAPPPTPSSSLLARRGKQAEVLESFSRLDEEEPWDPL